MNFGRNGINRLEFRQHNTQSFSWNLTEKQIEDIEINIIHESCPGSGDGRTELLGNEIAEVHLNGNKLDKTQLKNLSAGLYQLEITNLEGCISSQGITINPGHDIELELPDSIYISQTEISTGILVPIVWSDENQILDIQWNSGQVLDCNICSYPSIWVKEQDMLLLQVKSISGCVRNFTSILWPEQKQNNFLPTAFSPNGDGINDTWNIFGLQNFSSFHVRIYNRWGVRIAHRIISDSSSSLWDGMIKNEMWPPGPNIYQIEWLHQDGKKGKFFGTVELMR